VCVCASPAIVAERALKKPIPVIIIGARGCI